MELEALSNQEGSSAILSITSFEFPLWSQTSRLSSVWQCIVFVKDVCVYQSAGTCLTFLVEHKTK